MPELTYALLSAESVEARMAALNGWRTHQGALAKTFEFADYLAGASFASAVAWVAEQLNHHPDLLIGYRKVTVSTITHDSGGLTAFDFELAERIERLRGPVS
jgi:4a-hydroxytetrahydrobiopterin dehydratase